jgi:hypothetical protein
VGRIRNKREKSSFSHSRKQVVSGGKSMSSENIKIGDTVRIKGLRKDTCADMAVVDLITADMMYGGRLMQVKVAWFDFSPERKVQFAHFHPEALEVVSLGIDGK